MKVVLTSAAVGSKLKRGRRTPVTVPADHVGAALTLPAVGVAHGAERALRVTLAFWEMASDKETRQNNEKTLKPQ